MRIILSSLLILSLLDIAWPIQRETSLEELVSFTEKYDYQVDYGEWLIKETFKYEQLEEMQTQIIQAGFTNATADESTHIASYQRQISPDFAEQITIIPLSHNREIVVNYQLSGDIAKLFQDDDFEKPVKSFVGTIYTTAKHDYACISLSEHGMVSSGYFLEKLQKELNYQEIDRITEPDLIVISGYSNQFSQIIPTKNKKMNLQISARKRLNNEITFMIGTPILTTEY